MQATMHFDFYSKSYCYELLNMIQTITRR